MTFNSRAIGPHTYIQQRKPHLSALMGYSGPAAAPGRPSSHFQGESSCPNRTDTVRQPEKVRSASRRPIRPSSAARDSLVDRSVAVEMYTAADSHPFQARTCASSLASRSMLHWVTRQHAVPAGGRSRTVVCRWRGRLLNSCWFRTQHSTACQSGTGRYSFRRGRLTSTGAMVSTQPSISLPRMSDQCFWVVSIKALTSAAG